MSASSGKRIPLKPVGWMLAPELIANLRRILRSGRTDPRGWMAFYRGLAHDECRHCDGRLVPVNPTAASPPISKLEIPMFDMAELPAGGARRAAAAAAIDATAPTRDETAEIVAAEASRASTARPKVDGDAPETEPPPPDEAEVVWFDYIADIGDSGDAMYAVARACQADLELLSVGTRALPRALPPDDKRKVDVWCKKDHERERRAGNLPRGQFLFVGGDTAYHVASVVNVRARVLDPFTWAHDDLGDDCVKRTPEPRIYGIPGNHDWYDDLGGFGALFRRGEHSNAIKLPGFQRLQLGSYAAILLPLGWQLWGLDIDQGLDERQKRYFQSLHSGEPTSDTADVARGTSSPSPERLILCTPSPPVAFDAAIPPKEHSDALCQLGLPEAYLPGQSIAAGTCRLDLAGDIHQYARYRIPQATAPHPPTAPRATGAPEPPASYSAVVSGLGGAFHHPSFTSVGTLKPARRYPSPKHSLNAIATGLLHPTSLVVDSWIRMLPFLFGVILAFASVSSGGAGWLLRSALSWIPAVGGVRPDDDPSEVLRSLAMLGVLIVSGVLIWQAVKLFNATFNEQMKDPSRKRDIHETSLGTGPGQLFDPYRSYFLPMLIGLVALSLPFFFPLYPGPLRHHTAFLDIATVVIALLLVFGGAFVGWSVGAKHLSTGRKLAMALLGMAQGMAQFSVPLICARLACASVAAFVTTVVVVAATLALLVATRPLFRKGRVAIIVLLWIAVWAAGLGAIIGASGVGTATLPEIGDWWSLVRFGVGAALGAFLGVFLSTSYLAWYWAIAGLAHAHNNEVGGAARVTCFRQMIRFRIDATGLVGYVISIEDDGEKSPVEMKGGNLQFKLIDVFAIAPEGQESSDQQSG